MSPIDFTSRPTLSAEEQRVLLTAARRDLRRYTTYALGLRAGLRAVQVSALELGHVSEDGTTVRGTILVRGDLRQKRRESPRVLSPDLKDALDEYLHWRRSCPHFRRSMKTYRDGRGLERCRACKDITDVLRCPFFRSRQGTRISPSGLWQEFAELRSQLGLSQTLQFSCLRNTFFAGRSLALEVRS